MGGFSDGGIAHRDRTSRALVKIKLKNPSSSVFVYSGDYRVSVCAVRAEKGGRVLFSTVKMKNTGSLIPVCTVTTLFSFLFLK